MLSYVFVIINWFCYVNLDEYKIPKKYISGLEQLKSGKKKKWEISLIYEINCKFMF